MPAAVRGVAQPTCWRSPTRTPRLRRPLARASHNCRGRGSPTDRPADAGDTSGAAAVAGWSKRLLLLITRCWPLYGGGGEQSGLWQPLYWDRRRWHSLASALRGRRLRRRPAGTAVFADARDASEAVASRWGGEKLITTTATVGGGHSARADCHRHPSGGGVGATGVFAVADTPSPCPDGIVARGRLLLQSSLAPLVVIS